MGTQDDINYVKDKLDTIERCLLGDLKSDKEGVMERLNKLESHCNFSKKTMWLTFSTIIGIFIAAFVKLIGVKF